MRVAIVGGRLQGVEASYLAQKAGWEVILFDKEPLVPAIGLCDRYCQLDVTKVVQWLPYLKGIDLIIPAMENREALESIVRSASYAGVPLAFDLRAYEISSSKITSNRLFARLGIPAPTPWPDCKFPIILKPSNASGSEGVIKVKDLTEFQLIAEQRNLKGWVIEQYLEGPSFSIEVIAFSGCYKVLQITELHMDEGYDCKRVMAPAHLSPSLRQQFEQIALTLAKSLQLNGIMDIETILHQGQLKVLEIDARLPSQTPMVVYHSSGVNMLEIFGQAFVQGKAWQEFEVKERKGAIYEHVKVSKDCIEISGEHIMSNAGQLRVSHNFFGADEAITNYIPGQQNWVATLIATGITHQAAWNKRCEVIRQIQDELGIREYIDIDPYQKEKQDKIVNASGR